jgi:hypothetical protein
MFPKHPRSLSKFALGIKSSNKITSINDWQQYDVIFSSYKESWWAACHFLSPARRIGLRRQAVNDMWPI